MNISRCIRPSIIFIHVGRTKCNQWHYQELRQHFRFLIEGEQCFLVLYFAPLSESKNHPYHFLKSMGGSSKTTV